MEQDLDGLRTLLSGCSKALLAIVDEMRQAILFALMEGPCEGMRVGSITEKVRLSAPAVSKHLKTLREAGIVMVRKEGTMNFYCLNPDKTAIRNMVTLCQGILEALDVCEFRANQITEVLI